MGPTPRRPEHFCIEVVFLQIWRTTRPRSSTGSTGADFDHILVDAGGLTTPRRPA